MATAPPPTSEDSVRLLEEIRKQQEQIAVLLGEALIDPQAVAAKRERHCVLAGTVEQQDGGAPIDLGLLL